MLYLDNFYSPDGCQYKGQMKLIQNVDGNILAQHGKGLQSWPDGAIYDGFWHEGKMQGHGKFIHANKVVYEGEFVGNKANGIGT